MTLISALDQDKEKYCKSLVLERKIIFCCIGRFRNIKKNLELNSSANVFGSDVCSNFVRKREHFSVETIEVADKVQVA